MIGPDWPYGVIGTLCAFVAGAQIPLFALGISHALESYYMDWETTQREVKKIVFLLCGGAVITVTVHAIEHIFFRNHGRATYPSSFLDDLMKQPIQVLCFHRV
jgi:ATP-binding cassette subfamily B (MDR/TAP) protein 1